MTARVLVAGVGNIFFGDDGFGPAVAQRLAQNGPDGARVEDFGIRGLHLAYELLAGYEAAVLIDAVPKGGEPGTLYVIEPEPVACTQTPDAHRMDLQNVFASVRMLGGEPPPVTIVGCEPAAVEDGIGLSAPVERAVEAALPLVRRLVAAAVASVAEPETASRQARRPLSGRTQSDGDCSPSAGTRVHTKTQRGETMVKGLIWGGIGFAAAFAAERVSSSMLTDLKRYDTIRAMSGDPPFLVELGKMAGTMLMPMADSRKGEAVSELGTLQTDLMRYVRIRSM